MEPFRILEHTADVGFEAFGTTLEDVFANAARARGETYAYSLEDIFRMISVLQEPASTIFATAAFTGLRKSEIRGLLWENFREEALWVTQSVWERFVTEPKTTESKAPVAVIAPLAKRLGKRREANGAPASGFIFTSRPYGGRVVPMNLNSFLKWQVKPNLAKEGIQWHGWHAFRAIPSSELSDERRVRVPQCRRS